MLDAAAADACPVAALVTRNPYATYARIAQLLYPEPQFAPGRHPTAVVEDGAVVDPSAHVGALAFVAAARRSARVPSSGPARWCSTGVRVGADTRLVARVTLCDGVRVGERCLLHPGSVIGADGFGHAPESGAYVKVPQVGSVQLGDDVEVGANTTIDRGAIGDTVIDDGVKIDNQVQVGHNVRIGAHTVIAGCVGHFRQHHHRPALHDRRHGRHRRAPRDLRRRRAHGQDAWSAARSASRACTPSALPADEARHFRRNAARFQKLDELARRVRRLEGDAGRNEAQGDDDE